MGKISVVCIMSQQECSFHAEAFNRGSDDSITLLLVQRTIGQTQKKGEL